MSASTPWGIRPNTLSLIEEVRARVPLDSMVKRYTTLKRSGSALRGPCPIHGSSKGSTSFSVRNNRYRCFACGEHGDVFSFTMWAERVGFAEALRLRAHDAGLETPVNLDSTWSDHGLEEVRRREFEERRAHYEAEQ